MEKIKHFELLDIGRLNKYRVRVIIKDIDGNIYSGNCNCYGEMDDIE